MTDRLREGGIGGVGLDNLISGVKNFLPARKDFIVTRLVEALMDPSNASTQALTDTDEYLSFDPRAGRSTRPVQGGKGGSRIAFSEAIVFVVGGGSYVEFGNLGEWSSRHNVPNSSGTGIVGLGKKITYGATEIVPPGEFLKTLGSLARSSM